MSSWRQKVDEIPVTLAIGCVCLTITMLMDPFRPATHDLLRFGTCRGVDVGDGQAWRLLTYTFVHNGGALHLLFNMMALAWLGPICERSFGSLRFGLLWLGSGATGAIAGCWFHHWLLPLGGASGAVFGLMGAVLAAQARSGRTALSFVDDNSFRGFLGVVAMALLQGLLFPNVSHPAHLGGLVGGFALTFWFLDLGRAQRGARLRWQQAAIGALLLGALVSVTQPVTRPDWLLLRWAEAAPGPRRDRLRAGFLAAVGGGSGDDALMQAQVEVMRRMREPDDDR